MTKLATTFEVVDENVLLLSSDAHSARCIGGYKRYLPLPRYTVNVNMDRMEIDPASAAFQPYE
jgi:hypothetical protein